MNVLQYEKGYMQFVFIKDKLAITQGEEKTVHDVKSVEDLFKIQNDLFQSWLVEGLKISYRDIEFFNKVQCDIAGEFYIRKCVQCGYCCQKTACGFGEWDKELKQCKYLTKENKCSKYKVIMKEKSQIVSPAFGAGCCMTLFNLQRDRKIDSL